MNMCTIFFNILYTVDEIIHAGSYYCFFSKFDFEILFFLDIICGQFLVCYHDIAVHEVDKDRVCLVTTVAEVCFSNIPTSRQTFSTENLVTGTFGSMGLEQFHLINTFDDVC